MIETRGQKSIPSEVKMSLSPREIGSSHKSPISTAPTNREQYKYHIAHLFLSK